MGVTSGHVKNFRAPRGSTPTLEILATPLLPSRSRNRALTTTSDKRATRIQVSKQRRWRARLDVVAENFWGRDKQCAFFYVRVFNPFAPSYRNTTLSQCYRRNELEKKRNYDERIREIEHGSFSPLVFSTAGGMGATANVVYKRLASMIADKHQKAYSKAMNWLRCRLSFSLLRSAIMCLRGSRSSHHHPICSISGEIDLAISEGQASIWLNQTLSLYIFFVT